MVPYGWITAILRVSVQLYAPATLSAGGNPGTLSVGGWAGLRDSLEGFGEEKIASPPPVFNVGPSSP